MPGFTVTVAIPTYNRPEKLRRALISAENQTYQPTELLVCDNATAGDAVEKVVAEFAPRMPNLRFIRHQKNIGAAANFFYCLNESRSDLFMWLADDDEISPSCIREMVHMFDTIPELATAIPQWHFSNKSPESFEIMNGRSYKSSYWFFRASKFMYKSTDEAFYGLHRRELLLKARIGKYFWPNQGETMNLVYPFILTMVILGKVVVTNNRDAFWKNHDYGVKHYAPEIGARITFQRAMYNQFKYLMRRLNLQVMYLLNVKKMKGLFPLFFLLFVSFFAFLREVIHHFYSLVSRKLRHI